MSIKEYSINNEKFYEVYINLRSKKLNNVRVQKRCKKISTYSKAKAIERNFTEKAIIEISTKENLEQSWGTIVTKWYEYKKKDQFEPINELTLKDYFASIKTWTLNYWTQPISSLGKAQIKEILANVLSEGRSKSFQAKLKSNIHKVFDWAISHGEVKDILISPAMGIKISRKTEKDPLILSEVEVKKLLKYAYELDSPWFPIWSVALLTGLRNGELFALKWNDIDFENNLIRATRSFNKRTRKYSSTKGKYWRTIPMNEDLKSLLINLKNKSDNEFVLPRLRDWRQGYQARELKKFCISINIKPVTFHTLRSCFATLLLQNNIAIAPIMKICGWKDLDVMTRYIRLAGIDESGATQSLKIVPPQEAQKEMESILSF